MSSFSSVVRKPGTAIKPKAPLRRNIQRKTTAGTRPSSILETATDPIATANLEIDDAEPDVRAAQADEGRHSAPLLAHESPSETLNDTIPKIQALPIIQTTEPVHTQPTPTISPSIEVSDDQGRALSKDRSAHTEPGAQVSQVLRLSKPLTHRASEELDERTQRVLVLQEGQISRAESSIEPSQDAAVAESPSQSQGPPRKRRKTAPRAAPMLALSSSSSTPPGPLPPASPRSTIQASSLSQPSADLLQSAIERATSVSQLANSIDSETRSRPQRSNSRDELERLASGSSHEHVLSGNNLETRGKSNRRPKKTAAEQAAEVVAHALGEKSSQSRKRAKASESAENFQLVPAETTMGELVKDRKVGKTSQLETEMERDWDQILERRKEARDRAMEAAQSRRRKAYSNMNSLAAPIVPVAALMPGLTVINGTIVSEPDSRQVDRAAILEQTAMQDASTGVREDKAYFRRVNQATVGMKATSMKKFRWDEESTARFFKGLQMFGTDFLMIANMFPGLDRKQMKMKFIREENADKERVKQYLATRMPVDLDEYSQLTNTELQDPKDVQAEIEAEEKRLRDEDHDRRVREGFAAANPTDPILPSTEGEGINAQEGEDENASRFAEMARDIMAPKKKQRQAAAATRKRGSRSSRRPVDGLEEALGSVHDVPI